MLSLSMLSLTHALARRAACRSLFLLAFSALSAGAAAVTIAECRDADGSLFYGDSCPPGSEKVATRHLGGIVTAERPSSAQIAKDHPVTLYVVTDCDSCDLVRLMLHKRGIPFKERDVERDTALQQELRKVSGAARVPTVLIGEEAIPGFDRVQLQQRLSEVGYPLEPLPTGR